MPSAGRERPTGGLPSFLMLEASALLAGMANSAVLVVLPWLVLDRTGSPAGAGAVAAASALPLVVSTIFSGAVVDRFGWRRAAVASELLSTVSVVGIALLNLTGRLDLWALIVLSVLGSMLDQAGAVARECLLPTLARTSGLPIERFNGIHEAVWGLCALGGPALAGTLMALGGPTLALWTLGAMLLCSGLLCLGIRVSAEIRLQPDQDGPGLWTRTWEGLAFVRGDRLLRVVAVLTVVLAFAYVPVELVVLPTHFHAQGSPGALGTVLMAMALGTVMGTVAYAAVGHRFSRRKVFVLGSLTSAVVFLGFTLLPPYPIMAVLGLVVGFCYGPIQPIVNVVMQLRPPERLRGRVIGALTSFSYAAGPLGYLFAGGLVTWLGVQRALLVLAVLMITCLLSVSFLPMLRELDLLTLAPGPTPEQVEEPEPERPVEEKGRKGIRVHD